MRPFDELFAIAAGRKGGADALNARLAKPLSPDVTARLIAEGVIDKPASSKTALRTVQAAFNSWMEQSGRSLTEISQVLAMSL